MSYLNLEHKVLKIFKKENLPQKLIVLVSGGQDSMVLLSALSSLQKQLKLQIKVGNIHHGESSSVGLKDYRQKAWDLVRGYCAENGFEFLSNYEGEGVFQTAPESTLSSEAQFRDFREQLYKGWLGKNKGWSLCLGHHAGDLLENRLIQMIRGCGGKGFLSMSLKAGVKVRPLISISQREVNEYAAEKKVEFVEDPSNSSTKYLRNWLRNDWLPQLENIRVGAVGSLGQSLDNIAGELHGSMTQSAAEWLEVYNAEGRCLRVSQLKSLEPHVQMKCLFEFVSLQGVDNFGKNHLAEILKRLDSPQKKHKFELLKLVWVVEGNELFVSTSRDSPKVLS